MLVLEVVRKVVRKVVRDVVRMPRLVHLGIALGVTAFVLDVVVHLAPAGHHHSHFRPEEHLAHLAGIVAMALVLAGVVGDGIRRQRTNRHHSQGGQGHAHR